MYVLNAMFLVCFGRFTSRAEVIFINYPNGHPEEIHIVREGHLVQRIDNKAGAWKPCATHAMDLVQMYLRRTARSEHAKKRIAATKPALRVRGG
jgi:hypothetical protein